MADTQPNPAPILDALLGYQRTAALRSAIDLDLFTAIGEGVVDAAALAARVHASERGVRILCDYLVTLRLLTKSEESYGLSAEAAMFLDHRSPACIASCAHFMTNPVMMEGMHSLTQAVRHGGTALSEEGSMEPEHPMWVEFAQGMMPMMFPAAHEIAGIVACDPHPVGKVLDIAAGHGIFGIAMAQKFPQAQVTALDWAPVLAVASRNAAKFGVAERHHTMAGSAFELNLGEGYDVVLVTNFYHHFDVQTCRHLAARIFDALAPNGRMVTLEFAPNEDRVTPPELARFALTMLANTAHGDAYTFAEYDLMFRQAGFTANVKHQLQRSPQRVIVSHK
ncbi:MAG: class I SAM-dependent methyltransferase [Acidobacteria bacterium]|nr:class I SAM-dependent methyltransferase [Acidobacteriota bacterium]